MDERRKAAYRYLLHNGLVDIRNEGDMKKASAIADALHELAYFSARDFNDFDETLFWNAYIGVLPQFGISVERYRNSFEQVLAGHHASLDHVFKRN